MVYYPYCLCLAGGTAVTTKTGVKHIEDLLPGDKLLTSPKRNNGSNPKWTKFYAWGHREADTMAEFLVLTIGSGNGNKELVISPEHFVFVAEMGGKTVPKKAGQVCIGDKLFHYDEAGVLQLCPVTEIGLRQLRGIYAPFTMSGDFLANGFLVGCYAHVEDHWVAHAALAPLRLWYKLRGCKGMDKPTWSGGIHKYALNLMKIRDLLLPHHVETGLR